LRAPRPFESPRDPEEPCEEPEEPDDAEPCEPLECDEERALGEGAGDEDRELGAGACENDRELGGGAARSGPLRDGLYVSATRYERVAELRLGSA
jgi:hypothetical protein